jgi:hypothetical protein
VTQAHNLLRPILACAEIREIFQAASGAPAPEGVANGVKPSRVQVGKLRAVLIAGPNEIGSDDDDPSAHRFRPGSRDVWVIENWLLPPSDASTLSLVSFYQCYQGELILPQLKVVANYLNPDGLKRHELKELDALTRPSTCKATSLTPKKNLGLLLDVYSRKLCVREVVCENFGWLFVKPFMHFVEMRADGIFFRMHTELEKHLTLVAEMRTPEDDDRSTEEVLKIFAKHSPSLSFGMRLAMDFAAYVFGDEGDWFGWQALGEVAAAYDNYADGQWDDWKANPVFMLARLNSEEGGPKMARELTKLAEGRGGKLDVRVAQFLHTTPPLAHQYMRTAEYDGPLVILIDPTLRAQVKLFGEQSLPLSHCPQFDLLRQRLLRHYNMLFMANGVGEEWVKYYKALLPQQIGKGPAWYEVKLRSIIRARIGAGFGNVFAPPTMDELKEDRKASGDSKRRRFKLPPKPPLDMPPAITYDGEESDESGFSSDEEEEGEEGEEEGGEEGGEEGEGEDAAMADGDAENLWELEYREVQRRLKALGRPSIRARSH